MIKFENITKQFKTDFWAGPFTALDNVSFSITEGEVIGFLGANGAGKTTSLKILMKFIKQTSGSIFYDKSLGKNRQEIFKNIGYLPERPYFYPYLTGREMATYMGKLNELNHSEIAQNIKTLFARLNLAGALDRKIRDYSKGMLQRLGFITALMHSPRLIILDEPLSGLDPIGRKEFKDIIRELNMAEKTIFFSSHIVTDVEEVCKKVIALENGRVFYEGPIDQLIDDNTKGMLELILPSRLGDQFNNYLKYSDENSITYELPIRLKEEVLKIIYQEKIAITKLVSLKPTLEEIIYNTRTQR